MSFNSTLADRLKAMATLLELTGANPFRINAYAKAARAVENNSQELNKLSTSELVKIDGIGKGIAAHIRELAETGELAELNELQAAVPAGLAEVLDVQGLGPKTVRQLWKDLGVTDRQSLSRVIESGEILTLPRMGEKTVENIKRALSFASKSADRLPIGVAAPIADRLVERLRAVQGVTRAEVAGSIRRGRDTIGDIDILVVTKDAEAAQRAFCDADDVQEVIARGTTKCSIRLAVNIDTGRWQSGDESRHSIGVDLRIIDASSFGSAWLYFTGSKAHNVRLREIAQKQSLTLNEYGLFPDDKDAEGSPQSRGVKPVASKTEKQIYTKLGLVMVPPEIREDAGEFDLDQEPKLIEISDIKAELHAHTTASDGVMSLDELVGCAIGRGFHTIAVTDHSRSSAQANGLSVDRLRAQRDEIERARDRFGDQIRIMAGSEVDILADGSLDYDDDVLAELDLVVASPHVALSQDPVTATKRLIRAIEHPLVHIIGHPTGRLIGRRPGLSPAMDEVIAAAVEHNTALEINSHWMRLDLRDVHVRAVVEAGGLIAIDCDDHAPGDFDNLRFGVATGRRGWLTPGLCVNSWSRNKLESWLVSKR